MNRCIYYNKENLNFTSGEHIISAGLGGKRKLPHGYVSDEANHYFSSLELVALRESIIGGVRNFIGPGKRGTKVKVQDNGLIKCSKAYGPHIQILRMKQAQTAYYSEEYRYKLGFMFDKHTMLLPQVVFTFDSNLALVSQMYTPGEYDNMGNSLAYFFASLGTISPEVLIEVKTEFHPRKTFIIIGCFYDKWYYYMNLPFISVPTAIRLIQKQSEKLPRSVFIASGGEFDFSYILQGGFRDGSFQFLFVKTAFNVLAYKMGQKFVLDSRFDRLRDLILGRINYGVLYECQAESIKTWVSSRKEKDPHIVIIKSIERKLFGFVSFYGEMLYDFEMAQNIDESISFAYICDWHNEKEWIEDRVLVS